MLRRWATRLRGSCSASQRKKRLFNSQPRPRIKAARLPTRAVTLPQPTLFRVRLRVRRLTLNLRKFVLGLSIMLGAVACGVAPTKRISIEQEIVNLMANQQCDFAGIRLRESLIGFQFYYMLGAYQMVCKNDKTKAIEIWTVASRFGDERARARLVSMGVSPPAIQIPPMPPVQVVYPTASSARQPSQNSRPTQNTPPKTISNITLTGSSEVTGARLCYYSDGSTRRVAGGMVCPRSN
jgi:hypothetical protein